MKTLKLLAVAAVLLTGCGTPKIWYQAGKTPAEARRDAAACRVEVAKADNPLALFHWAIWMANEGNKKVIFDNCMISKGWEITPSTSIPNGQAYPRR